ncbi:2-dehydropantoate 2-reductase [Backusella circina FSU 941]|nr:2-dehydropantoate 2-reductase [Backusella circina FSU 941]
MRVHILGTGAIGCHIGSMLKMHNNKVTLMLRSEEHLQDFKKRQSTITYRTKDKHMPVEGFDAVSTLNSIQDPIDTLVVSTKSHYTVNALAPLVSRLTSNSTVLLLQNGMGVSDELMEKLWPVPSTSPRIFIGVNRHAVERVAPYEIIHHSGYQEENSLMIGEYPTTSSNSGDSHSQPNAFADILTSIPELNCVIMSWDQIKVKMIHKLVMNMGINSIATVLNFKNKGLSYNDNPAAMRLMKNVCDEAYAVLKDDLPQDESAEKFLGYVLQILNIAGENTCSTLQDLKAKNLTEIDYLNGYVCKRGKILNIPTPVNQTLVDLVHAKECTYNMP